jgi:hypothetical protein
MTVDALYQFVLRKGEACRPVDGNDEVFRRFRKYGLPGSRTILVVASVESDVCVVSLVGFSHEIMWLVGIKRIEDLDVVSRALEVLETGRALSDLLVCGGKSVIQCRHRI